MRSVPYGPEVETESDDMARFGGTVVGYNQTEPLPEILAPPSPKVTDLKTRGARVRSTQHVTRMIDLFTAGGGQDPIWTLLEISSGYRLRFNEDTGTLRREEFEKPPDFKTRAFAAGELAQYAYPKRKAVEVTGKDGAPMSFAVVADTGELPVMPSEEEIKAMREQRIREARNVEQLSDSDEE
jgi:hypothetical protein